MSKTMLLGVIGSPVAHSLSPLMHNTGLRALGLDAIMIPWDIPPGAAREFVRAFRLLGMGGCAVTLPHKQDVAGEVDFLTKNAEQAGAVNTLFWRDGLLGGENTDVAGLKAPLETKSLPNHWCGIILGAGGAARAAVVALRQLGADEICITTRSDGRSRGLAEEFGLTYVPWRQRGDIRPDLVLNTTPLGMTGAHENETPYDASWYAPDMIVYDIVYTPSRTRLLREAEAAGCRLVSGLEMFIGQGAAQFELWTGMSMPKESADAVKAKLYGS